MTAPFPIHPDAELVELRTGDCGCPEEHYLFNGVDLVIHYDPETAAAPAQADAHMDGGDWGEAEATVFGQAREVARQAIFAWAARMTEGPAA